MSVAIINPFNQIIQFSKGFCPQNDFYNEVYKSIKNFIFNNKETNNTIVLDVCNEKLESVLLNRFDVPLTEITNELINSFLIDFKSFPINSNDGKEINLGSELQNNFNEFVKKEFKITPYVSEKFFPFLLNQDRYFELKFVFQSKWDKCIFNLLITVLDSNIIQCFSNKIKGIFFLFLNKN